MPDAWGSPGAYAALQNMTIEGVPLVGTLPAAWGGNESFPALLDLEIGASSQADAPRVDVFGSLPAEWGHASAFQQLELLYLHGCKLTGNETSCSYSLLCLCSPR